MILYHGTTAEINTVSLFYSKDRKDFGKGFYTTSDFNQAVMFARRLKKFEMAKGNCYAKAYVYSFNVSELYLQSLNILNLDRNSIAWINYIIQNRCYGITDNYDLVIGQVADSRTQELLSSFISKYKNGATDKDKTMLISKLKPGNLVDQYCFKTDKAISILNKKELGKRKEIK